MNEPKENPPMVAADGSKSVGVRCCDAAFPTAAEADAHEFACVAARAKREISADIAAGHVPPTVRTFSELHDYVDANYYGGAFGWPLDDTEAACDFWNRVQDAVDEWLREGRPGAHA